MAADILTGLWLTEQFGSSGRVVSEGCRDPSHQADLGESTIYLW